ncbi:MAG: hypothetical protein JWO59_916 [Chloroflexi bacterium]|nr:hypothetical protein [Chloroflexota bacterium]
MAAATKTKTPGVLITTDGQWRCNNCSRLTVNTPVCAGAHDDGSPSCGKAVCSHCADRCIRCRALLCPDCSKRSKVGSLCVQCPTPAGGREAYLQRQRARAATAANPSTSGVDWRSDSDRAYKAAAEAQQSVDDAMRRADEIERSLNEMKARMRKAEERKGANN